MISDVINLISEYLTHTERRILSLTCRTNYDNMNVSNICYISEITTIGVLKWAIIYNYIPEEFICHYTRMNNNRELYEYVKETHNIEETFSCEKIIQKGCLSLLKFGINKNYYWNNGMITRAAKYGHLHILEWGLQNGIKLTRDIKKYAGYSGNIEVILWIRDNNIYLDDNDHIIFVELIKGPTPNNKKIEIIQLLIGKGYESYIDSLLVAAEYGLFEIVKYLHKSSYTMQQYLNERLCISAAKNGHKHIIEWAIENGYSIIPETVQSAAENNHVELVKWLYPRTRPDIVITSGAAQGGNLELLGWLIHNNCQINTGELLKCAAYGGHNHIISWVLEKFNCNTKSLEVCTFAAYGGKLETLKFLKQKNFPWDYRVLIYAVINGDIDMIKWTLMNGCPWTDVIYSDLVKLDNIEIFDWLYENNYKPPQRLIYSTIRQNNLELIIWAINHGCVFDDHAKEIAIMENYTRLLDLF